MLTDPHLWSHVSDCLPDDHPLAWQTVYCVVCDEMLHASNNECMDTWVETGRGAYCLLDFVKAIKDDRGDGEVYYVVDDEWGLPL